MSKSFCLLIPVKPYVRQYLALKLGHDYRLNRSQPIGLYLYALLRRRKEERRYEEMLSRYTDRFEVTLSRKQALDEGCFVELPGQLIIDFSSFVESFFFQEYYQFVQLRRQLGYSITQARREFIAEYQLTEAHIAEDTLTRQFQRYRQRNGEVMMKVEPKRVILSSNRPDSLPSLLPSAA